MLKVKIENLKPGDVIIEEIGNAFRLPLVSSGTVVTKEIILGLKKRLGTEYIVKVKADRQEKPVRVFKNLSSINIEDIKKTINEVFGDRKDYSDTKQVIIENYTILEDVFQNFAKTMTFNEKYFAQIAKEITESLFVSDLEFNPALAYLVELEHWDCQTFNHSINVALLTLLIGYKKKLDRKYLTSLTLGGLLHDIGKFIYSKFIDADLFDILNKPGKLTPAEYEKVKRHVDVEDFFKDKFLNLPKQSRENIIYGAVDHHERFNGVGYLKGKKGLSISLSGRIVAIADVYDALVRERSYKSMMKSFEAMRKVLKMNEMGFFDKSLCNIFYLTMGLYPIGSYILTNYGPAIVTNQNFRNPERPFIQLFNQNQFDNEEINTLKEKEIEIIE